jgi:PAS domain S-box-containing protein
MKHTPLTTPGLPENNAIFDILERITDGFYALDKDWRVVYWNKEAEQMLGKSRQEILGKNIWEVFPEAVDLKFYPLYHQCLREQKPMHFEGFYPPLNVWAEFNVYPSPEGLSVFFKNINERKEAEEEIRRLSLVARETGNAVSLIERDGRIAWVNKAFTNITGYSLEEALGKKISELLNGPDADIVTITEMKEAFSRGFPFHAEILSYTKRGEKVWLDASGQPMFTPEGQVQQYFIIQTDITERKKMEEQIEAHQKLTTSAVIEAQEKERALVGQELHDNVNQVLTSVKLYLELCLSGSEKTEDLLKNSIRLQQACINEIRDLSKRLSAPSLGNINPKDSIKELVDTVAATNQFELHLDTSDLANIKISQELHLAIYRIVQEHLTNILKHAEASRVQIFFDHVDHELILKIIDNGKGFNPKQNSSGIGISNMKTRAETVKGRLFINSAPGIGSVLIVHLPLKDSNLQCP